MKVLGLVLARAGSKGVPGKNIRELNGRPLIEYTIEQAKNAKSLDRIVLSTDSQKIRQMGLLLGIEAPFLRPKKFATDSATSISVIIHCLDYLRKLEAYVPDAVFLLRPTSPMRTSGQIEAAIKIMKEVDVDSVADFYPVRELPHFMYHKRSSGGKLERFIDFQNVPERRQDFPELYAMGASTILSKTSYLYREDCRGGHETINSADFAPIYTDQNSGIDIDTEDDFLLAEYIIKKRLSSSEL